MSRPLRVQCAIDAPVPVLRRAFAADPGEWLPGPARWHASGRWNVRLTAGRLSRIVACTVGDLWQVGDERWRLLAWDPTSRPGDALPVDRGLPSLTGELGLVPEIGGAVLVLRGTYDPPAGTVGAVADSAGLSRVAEATARRFVTEVAGRLRAMAAGGTGGPQD